MLLNTHKEIKLKEIKNKKTISLRIYSARRIQRVFRNTTQCAICLQLVQKKPGCCHTLHNSCKEKWFNTGKTTCPTCRAELSCSLEYKKQYFINSNKLLRQLKQSIEIWDPNYFDEEAFKCWHRKILLSDYYVDLITRGLINNKKKILPQYENSFEKMDMIIHSTNTLIGELSDYLEQLTQLNENI